MSVLFSFLPNLDNLSVAPCMSTARNTVYCSFLVGCALRLDLITKKLRTLVYKKI